MERKIDSARKIDSLTDEEIQALRANEELAEQRRRLKGAGPGKKKARPLLVAMGDSWFDYRPGLDLIFWLKKSYGYEINNYGQAGDTLENMVYGTEYRSNWQRLPCRLKEVLDDIETNQPRAVLFSATGNDLAGEALDAYFNHEASGLPAERTQHIAYMFDEVFFNAYASFIQAVIDSWKASSPPIVIGHTYANAVPDGRGVINIGHLHWIGPWLRPTFTRKGYTDLDQTSGYIKTLMDALVRMLDKLQAKYPKNFHYVNFRNDIKYADWVNELHLTNSGFNRCAFSIAAQLKSLGIG